MAANGGGLVNFCPFGAGTLQIVNSTFSGNAAGVGGGIINSGGAGIATVNIGSTILNAGASGANIFNNSGTITSRGYNLSSDDGGGFLTATGDQTNTPPLLGPLQLNGGQTPTHALLSGSPAIDAGFNFSGDTTDQRGSNRTVIVSGIVNGGDGTDIGAFEVQTPFNHPPVALCTNVTVSADSNCVATASIDNGSDDPDAGDSIVSSSQSPAGPYAFGNTPVTLTVVDSHGASNSCDGVVTVVDTTPPVVHCPNNIVATNDAGQCSAVVSFTPTASDNCGVASLTSDPASGSVFSHGSTNVVVTAVDNAGNTNTCTFSVTVVDLEAPLVECRQAPNPSSGKVSEPGKNGSTGVNPNGYYQVLAKDNCDASPNIYVKDTASTFVAGPFKDGDIVRIKHAGGAPSSGPGTAPVVAVINLKGNGLAVATDADGNTTPDASGCLMQASIKK